MKKRDAGREISCALAFEIAEGMGVDPEEVGRTADMLDIRVPRTFTRKCTLKGC